MHRRAFLTRSMSGLGAACAASVGARLVQTGKRIQIRGAYGSPKTFWEKGKRLNDYGINAVFVHSGSIDEALVRRAREEGAKVFAEFATFNGDDWLTRRDGQQEH